MGEVLRNPIILITLFNLNILLLSKQCRHLRVFEYMFIFVFEMIVCNILLFWL
mgnify:CR=1|nr:MAG TPA: hypothetical protein [Caudoviricetes sp.]